MSWWKRLLHGRSALTSSEQYRAVCLTLPAWREQSPEGDLRVWQDPQNDILSLAIPDDPFEYPDLSDVDTLRCWSRSLARDRRAGLVEVRTFEGTLGAAFGLIYKRLEKPAYVFTGMLFVPGKNQIWTVVAGERGMTGIREATVTAELANEGKLTPQNYESFWHDPYEPAYSGVHISVLRFVSDDECYDDRFQTHPLSKVRRVMTALPDSVQVLNSVTEADDFQNEKPN